MLAALLLCAFARFAAALRTPSEFMPAAMRARTPSEFMPAAAMRAPVPVRAFFANGTQAVELQTYSVAGTPYRYSRDAVYHIVGQGNGSTTLHLWQPLQLEAVAIHIAAAAAVVQQHPGLQVNISSLGFGGVGQEPMTAAYPTVTMVGTTRFATRFAAGDVADLSDYFEQYALQKGTVLSDDFLKYLFYDFSRGGSWYAVPLISDTRVLYANTTSLKAAGMQLPPPLGPSANTTERWSWKQLAQAAVSLHKSTNQSTFLVREGYANDETFTTLSAVRDYGGYLFTTASNGSMQCHLNHNGALTALFTEVVHPLLLHTGMQPSPALLNTTEPSGLTAVFQEWLQTSYRPQELQPLFPGPTYSGVTDRFPGFAIVPPSATNASYPEMGVAFAPGTFSLLGGSGLILSAHVSPAQKDLGWKLIQEMLALASEYAVLMQTPPPFYSLLTLPEWQTPQWQVVVQQLRQSVPPEYPAASNPIITDKIFNNYVPLRHAWMDMQYKGVSAKSAAEFAVESINFLLQPVCTLQDHSDPLCDLCSSQDYASEVGECGTSNTRRVTFVLMEQRTGCLETGTKPRDLSLSCSFLSMHSIQGSTVLALSVLVAAVALGSAIWLLSMEDSTSLEVAQPGLLAAMCAGIVTLAVASSLYINHNNCVGFLWMVTVGLDVTVGCIFCRVYRIFKLFQPLLPRSAVASTNAAAIGVKRGRRGSKSRTARFGRHAAALVAATIAVDVLLLLLWTNLGIYAHRVQTVFVQGSLLLEQETCGSSSAAWSTIYLALKLVTLTVTAYYAFVARRVSEQLLESRAILYSAFNSLVVMLLYVMLLVASPSATALLAAQCYAIILTSSVPLVLIVLPRVYDNMKGRKIDISREVSLTASTRSGNPPGAMAQTMAQT